MHASGNAWYSPEAVRDSIAMASGLRDLLETATAGPRRAEPSGSGASPPKKKKSGSQITAEQLEKIVMGDSEPLLAHQNEDELWDLAERGDTDVPIETFEVSTLLRENANRVISVIQSKGVRKTGVFDIEVRVEFPDVSEVAAVWTTLRQALARKVP